MQMSEYVLIRNSFLTFINQKAAKSLAKVSPARVGKGGGTLGVTALGERYRLGNEEPGENWRCFWNGRFLAAEFLFQIKDGTDSSPGLGQSI
ncbi:MULTISPECIES: hypothetical protein [unclassified Janthinobacterium]|uniref:hypothetical protein n=1 Tax=unclassified Janthinobacterium TaxID=2610881 RepID=UPI0025AEE733|nr:MULTISPECIES: hypothetical protein [unclassified Janthinobacterium]MDN2713805.1 hypothetical protein [Janthinobacterium sp. SUN120]MDO8039591.1 hypothetical protein [Janthinobacterium sp. SUN137]